VELLAVAKVSEDEVRSLDQIDRHAVEPPPLELLRHRPPKVSHRHVRRQLRSVDPLALLVGHLVHHQVIVGLALEHEGVHRGHGDGSLGDVDEVLVLALDLDLKPDGLEHVAVPAIAVVAEPLDRVPSVAVVLAQVSLALALDARESGQAAQRHKSGQLTEIGDELVGCAYFWLTDCSSLARRLPSLPAWSANWLVPSIEATNGA